MLGRFYPLVISPAAEPPRFPLYFSKLLRNNLAMIPERAYHEPLVGDGRPLLGTWQGIYLFEHRAAPHRRELVLHLSGE